MSYEARQIRIGEIKGLLAQGYEIEVDSPDGWVGVNFFIDKGLHEEYVLTMNDGSVVLCNAEHLFETSFGWVSACELKGRGEVNFLTKAGYDVGYVTHTGNMIPIVDINVEHDNHRYYTNGVSSHNTGVGKSLFMCHCASANLKDHKNVLYITLELAEERVAERIDANLLDCPIQDLIDMPRATYDKRMARLKEQSNGKLIIKEYPTASAGSANFRHLLNELKIKRNFTPDIIYIDYLNICISSRIKAGSNVNSYTIVKAIAEELRGLAVEFDVPIVSATQTNRTGFSSSDVGLEDTSESFGLPATADFMFALISTEELAQQGQILVKQLKNRYSDPDQFKRFVVGIDKSRMRVFDVDDPTADLVVDTPVMDNTRVGERMSEDRKHSFKGFK